MSASESEIAAALGEPVEIVHTHASMVFLGATRVYKVKKPVDFGFLDYSSLGKREAMCRAEVELNRRLAPDVYLGVVPITDEGDRLALDGDGPTIEWAVLMRRLPESACWSSMLARGALTPAHMRMLGQRLAAFHRTAKRGPEIAAHARFVEVAQACRDNFTALADFDAALVERLRGATERALAAGRALLEARVHAGIPCELHGDLRLEHVYDVGGDAHVDDLRIVDCVEFSDALRCGDPVSDIAFLAMDLRMHGGWALADALVESWLSSDPEAHALLPLFCAYRSAVRAKVRALQGDEARARGHLLLAIAELAPPDERPCLVLVAGLPGTGKSRLADDLASHARLEWIRADAVRKQLAGIDVHASGKAAVEGGIYTKSWNDRTYGECLARAEAILARGGRVLVDASFKEERRRSELVELAQRMGARVRILVCSAPAEVVRTRLADRGDDPSDADFGIYQHALRTWEPFADATRALVATIDTARPHDATVAHALAQLRDAGVLAPANALAA
ncbi:MAG TPA: AAA family ATPase [Nannocystaceae bacterium]|nr:AAA family ATPase [Nannocystaceae bacterium]